MDSQREEGPAPLLWRFSDFLKWAELCPSEPEIGHALMRLVMTGQEIPHACEVLDSFPLYSRMILIFPYHILLCTKLFTRSYFFFFCNSTGGGVVARLSSF